MKNSGAEKICVFGIGNDSRGDDGLGWAFLKKLEASDLEVDIYYRYQLMVEDADLIQQYERVVFVDAYAAKLENGFDLQRCRMSKIGSFSTHGVHPGELLRIGQDLFDNSPEAWLFMIAGKKWGFSGRISKFGIQNLNDSFEFFESWLKGIQKETNQMEMAEI